ncbi:MAG: hypothetical protein KBB86_01485 [Candidatus Pacebacteria bacterium]|nr:hypothetical protein [Candidatus Paceibacterota bacterium]
MEKKAHVHVQETQEERDIALFALERILRSNLFTLRKVDDVVKEILELGLSLPEGKTADNALQTSFIYSAKTSYEVIINTEALNGNFIKPGLPSALIRDKNKKRLFYREFKRDDFNKVFGKIIVYAKFCKNIADFKPKGMHLFEDRALGELHYRWVGPKGKVLPFNVRDFLDGLDAEECESILKSESRRKSYYKTSENTVENRKRDMKKTW